MKKKVAKPGDKKSAANEDEKFPGYPAYPANEDITYRGEQENLDVEKVTRSSRINNELAREASENPAELDEEGLDVPGADLDVRHASGVSAQHRSEGLAVAPLH